VALILFGIIASVLGLLGFTVKGIIGHLLRRPRVDAWYCERDWPTTGDDWRALDVILYRPLPKWARMLGPLPSIQAATVRVAIRNNETDDPVHVSDYLLTERDGTTSIPPDVTLTIAEIYTYGARLSAKMGGVQKPLAPGTYRCTVDIISDERLPPHNAIFTIGITPDRSQWIQRVVQR
jgi:hypothetical protein